MATPRISRSVYFNLDLDEKVKMRAAKEGRSINWTISTLLEKALGSDDASSQAEESHQDTKD